VIAASSQIGRDCYVGPGATIQCALIGNRVVIFGGAQIGREGFGFVAGPRSAERLPQIGRVVIQDDVEIGTNTTVDRGAMADTIIGEGTKIDNLVQIAHNVSIGRGCMIAGKVGLSGSVTLGDGVQIGGGAGIADHLTIGSGAQLAAGSGLMHDIPAGARWAGYPAGRSTRRSVSSPRCGGWWRPGSRRRARMAADGQSTLDSVDINALLRMLPHRYPFLLVDRIHSIDDDVSAIGIKNVTPTSRISRDTSRSARHARRADRRGDGADGRRHLPVEDAQRETLARLFHDDRQCQVPPPGRARRQARAACQETQAPRQYLEVRVRGHRRRHKGRRGGDYAMMTPADAG